MKKTIIISSLLIMVFGAGLVFAQNPGQISSAAYNNNSDCPTTKGHPSSKNCVKLTEEQKTQLKDLHQKFKDETYELRLTKVQKSLQIRMMLETSNPDRNKLHQLSKEISKAEAQLRIKAIDLKLEVKKIAPELSMPGHFNDSLFDNRRGGRGPKGGRMGNSGPFSIF